MEIYNESVRDLLSSDSSQLRLLDDPEVIFHFGYFEELVYAKFISKLTICFFDRKELLLRNSLKKF